MKTKIKRHSRSALSILLTICMLVSCMTVGLIATDAAKMQSEEVGATYYIWKSDSGGSNSSEYTCIGTSPQTFSVTTGRNYYIAVSTSATDISSGTVWLTGADVSGVSTSSVGTQGFDSKQAVRFSMASADTVKVSYSSGSKIKIEKGTSTSSCTTNHKMIVTGSQQLTNTSTWQNTWSGAGTRNQMTYNSDIGMYEIKYTNIDASASSSSYFRFRILDLTTKGDPDTSWETDKGYAQGSGAITDASNILQGTSKTTAGSDNTFQFSLKQKANITIYLDDSKLSTNTAIQVIVTPAVSTVTPGSAKVGSTVTSEAGTIKVNNSTSPVENIAYGGSVTLTATAGDDYVFSQWEDNSNLTYANKNAATTTATVTGSTTVNAIFVPKSYTVSKGTGAGFTITAPSSNQSKQWGSSVTVTAKADSLYALNYLYYLNDNTGSEVKIGADATSAEITNGTMTRTLSSMPKNNITVYAKVHEKTSNTITYGVCTDQSGYGYVNVGLYHNSASTIKYTIDSGSKVLEGDKVNFCARPAVGYVFVGWYNTSAATGGTLLSASQDYTVTSPSGNYYARFRAGTDPAVASTGVRLLFKKSDYSSKSYYIYTWNGSTKYNGDWHGKLITSMSTITNGGGTEYYYYDYTATSFTAIMNDSDSQSGNISISGAGTYTVSFDGGTTGSKSSYTSVTDGATDAYYPVKYYVTNPDKGNMASTYTNAFAKKSTATNLYFKASDTTNWKAKVTTTGFTSDDTNYETTSTSRSKTMYSSYREHKATVTFIEKKYYKVNFSAGAGGTVAATAGGKTITSGTPVMEGTSVTITATPKDGYAVSGWTASGSLTGGTSTNASRTFTIGADTTAKVYFSASKGTSNTNTYFGYGTNSTGDNIHPSNWTAWSSTYVRDGHVFAYIDTVTANNYYFISAYNSAVTSTSSDSDKNKLQYYRKDNEVSDTSQLPYGTTEFPNDITGIQRFSWGSNNEKNYDGINYYVRFKVSSKVKGVIIDLGPDDGSGHAQTHVGDGNHNFNANCYRIIPVYNKEVGKVTVYAKDASYRSNDTYDYLPGIADTVITTGTYVTNRTQHSEFETAVATKGKSITVTTTIDSTNRSKYYVKGFSVNGVTPELYTWKSSGVYSMTFNIPADFDKDYLEITPIYYRKDLSTVQFYIENYDEAFQNTGWGNTLSIYPYYQNTSNKNNAFGGYPGQPVINYGGRRFIEIPTSYNSKTIQGVTLSNDYFDIVHRDYCREVDDHLQTYDYDDFYKIYKETSDGKEVNGRTTVADQITFAFKHRTKTNNFSDNSTSQTYSNTGNKNVPAPYASFAVSEKDTKFQNGWEPLLDYHDRPIDLFGKQLSSADQTKEPLLVVSDDYAITYAGRYATTWTVYRKNGTSYTKIAEIAPSALIVATQARLGTSTYPAVTDETGYPTTTGHKLADYSDEYQALKAYANTPVQITYESAIRNQDGYEKHWSMTGGSSEVSKRSDGRWFYSYQGEIINADLRIDYTDEYKGEESTDWTTDSYKNNTNTGTVTGATVHFTNTAGDTAEGPYDLTDFHDTADYDGTIYSNFNHYYKFVATEGSGYIFQGWYMERDGISTAVNADDIKKLTGKSQMTSNATFVARYVKNPAGHITINHLMDDGSTGTGTTYIGIEKSNDGTNWTWITGDGTDHFERADMFSVTDTNVMSYNSGYTLRVTLKTVVASDTSFDRFSANDDEHSPNYFSSEVTTSGTTSTTSFEVPVDDLFAIVDDFPKQQFDTLTYFSHTTKRPELVINHNLDPTSDSTAEGDTYVKVEVLSAGGSVVATYGGDETDGYAKGKDLVIPSTYYNGTDDYRIKVYLKTEMQGFAQFDHFSILGYIITNAPGPNGESITLSSSTDQRTKYAVCTFSASACFNRGERVLPYLSRLIVPDYKYRFKYTYPSYIKNSDGTYSNRSYTVLESFAPEELTEYMTLNNGDLAFQNDNKKLSFICLKAPYEDNFQKTLDFSKNSVITGRGYASTDYTMTLDVSVSPENEQLSAYFDFPYATTGSNEFIPVVNGDKVEKTDSNRQGKTDLFGRDWFVTNDVRNEGIAGTPEFVKAPLIIYDGTTPMYFKYWTVKTEGTGKNASREYTRCYDYEFNLAIFQNCIITPEYDNKKFKDRGMASEPTSYNDYGRFDPDVNRTYYELGATGVTITFLENSRNQYNNGDCGTVQNTNQTGAADRIYSDFLLTFDNIPKTKLSEVYAGQKQAGLIIQPVGRLTEGETIGIDTDYATRFAGKTPAEIETAIEAGDFSGLLKSQFDVSKLDNKNRLQYYYGIDNAAAKKATDQKDDDGILRVGNANSNKTLVFKAFAYIGDGNGTGKLTNVVVSPKPVYFTIYDTATIAPGYYMPNTSGSGN